MWLIMVLPSIIITSFLVLGFRNEYTPKVELTYTNKIFDIKDQAYKSDDITSVISSLSALTNGGKEAHG